MEKSFNPEPYNQGELSPQVIGEPSIEVLDFQSVQEFLRKQASEFTFSPLEYIAGPDEKKQSIFLKVANIMGDLDRVPKSGYNKNHDYHYVTESDVVGAVRPLMAKNKLVMMPSIKTYKQEDIATKYSKLYMGTIEIEWILRDAESYEQVKFTMIGKGTDNLEKDIYKAISGNKKYALISLFMIDSGDDPERNDSPTDSRQNDPAPNNQNQGQNRSNQKSNTNTPQHGPKTNAGQSEQSEPPVKQPTKGDLLTRWVVLAGSEKGKKETREEFDSWYKKKQEEGRDHLWMVQALTNKIHEKNKKEKEKEKAQENTKGQAGPDEQEGQASE